MEKLKLGDRAVVRLGEREDQVVEITEVGATSYCATGWGPNVPSFDGAVPVTHYKARVVNTGEEIEVSTLRLGKLSKKSPEPPTGE